MRSGMKVVCINDQFPDWTKKLYKRMPVKDVTYTVRDVFLGRGLQGDGEVGITLHEIINPPDPTHIGKSEMGFSSERFAPLQDQDDEMEVEKEELVTA